jgi:hypothetical protein
MLERNTYGVGVKALSIVGFFVKLGISDTYFNAIQH